MSKNIERRLKEHNKGSNRYTKGHIPWNVIYTESYPDWNSARVREKFLKSTRGKDWLRENNIL